MYMLQDACFLSMHALFGKPQHRAIQLRNMVQNQALIILVDSKSSHTFLNSAIAAKLKLDTIAIPQMTVQVANGTSISCTTEVQNFDWWI
jgi:predicted aspartyl protease